MKGGNFVFLMNPLTCPFCRVKRQNVTGFCHNCGVKLFSSTAYDFHKFEAETPIRNWWAFHKFDGWKFRDFYMIENAKPLCPIIKIDLKALDKNYGRQTTPSQVAAAFKDPKNRVRHRRTK